MKTNNKIQHIVLTSFLCLALGACQPSEKVIERVSNNGTTEVKVVSKNSKASEISEAAEALVTPYHFMIAGRMFDMALEIDSQDPKALFYKKLLQPVLHTKGLAKRLAPFAHASISVARFIQQVNQLPDSSLKEFLLSSNDELKSAKDLQTYLVEDRESLIEARAYALEADLSKVVIKLNPMLFGQHILKNMAKSCEVFEDPDTETFQVSCKSSEAATVKMEKADGIALGQSLAYGAVNLILATAYTVDGAETLNFDLLKSMTPKQQLEQLTNLNGLGKLSRDEKITSILKMGYDFKDAMEYVLANQNTLCPDSQPPVEPPSVWELFRKFHQDYFEENPPPVNPWVNSACEKNSNSAECNQLKAVYYGYYNEKRQAEEKYWNQYKKDYLGYQIALEKYNNQRPGYLWSSNTCIKNKSTFQKDLSLLNAILSGPAYVLVQAAQGDRSMKLNAPSFLSNPVKDLRSIVPSKFNQCGQATGLVDPTLGGLFPDADANLLLKTKCK